MPEYVIIKGTVKRGKKHLRAGEVIELTAAEKKKMDPNDDTIVSKEKAAALKQIADAKERIAQLTQAEKDELLAKHLPKAEAPNLPKAEAPKADEKKDDKSGKGK